ncbi:lysozyme inhibitor LprI family protein [Neogemmobacter tilapiae]|uniref:lysozyme inhibitor LprI family protein n=1 Tax=Neogemmobacter tilapiae TaxID=875041 RepID=UPI001671ECC5
MGLWLHLLNFEQRKIEAWALLKDNQIVQTGKERPDAHHTAIEERDLWNAYAAAQCQFEVAQHSGGTIGITEEPHCAMRLTVKRLFDLRPFLAAIAGKPVP